MYNPSAQTNWKKRLLQLRHDWYLRQYAAAREFGVPLPPVYTDKNTNALSRCVCDWLKFHHHYFNRINTQGQCRLETVDLGYGRTIKKAHWTRGTTNIGSSDLISIINSKHVALEIKCKATKDKLRPDQLKEKDRVEAAGGIYYVVTDMPNFVKWYDEFIESQL